MSLLEAPSSTGRRVTVDQTAALIIICWAATIVPRLLGSILAPKYRTSVGDAVSGGSPIASLAQIGLNLMLVACCLAILVRNVRQLPTDRGLVLVALIAPWVYVICRDLYIDHRPKLAGYLYPLIVLAIWALRPQLKRLALIGYLTGIAAIISLILAIVIPAKGVFSASTGELIAPEKQILPWGILVGIFANGNALGQFLLFGLPAVALIRRRVDQMVISLLIVGALIWTSSRSSLGGALAVLITFVTVAVLRRSAGPFVSLILTVSTGAALVIIPSVTHADEAFTNRGYIWKMSIAQGAVDPWFGLGTTWYNDVGKYVNSLPDTAFNGHNLYVHSLVTGGFVYIVLLASMVAILVYFAIAWAGRGVAYPTAFLVAFFITGTLEVTFGLIDHNYMFIVQTIPMAVIVFAPIGQLPGRDEWDRTDDDTRRYEVIG